MSIRLGVDLGTTFTSAAVADDGAVDVVRLESDTSAMPSVVAFDGDTVLTGVAAERRLAESPGSGAREFKRRLGDTTPHVVAVRQAIMALVDAVGAREVVGLSPLVSAAADEVGRIGVVIHVHIGRSRGHRPSVSGRANHSANKRDPMAVTV